MIVWVVVRSWDYDYSEVIGVFATEESAESAAAQTTPRRHCSYEVERLEVQP